MIYLEDNVVHKSVNANQYPPTEGGREILLATGFLMQIGRVVPATSFAEAVLFARPDLCHKRSIPVTQNHEIGRSPR